MSIIRSLMGVGVPAAQAQQVVGDVLSSATATGTTQSDALEIGHGHNVISTVTSGTGVKLSRRAVQGDSIYVYNDGSNDLLVYPYTGETINGGSANASVTVTQGQWNKFTKTGNAAWKCSYDSGLFLQSGSGAGPRTLQAKNREIVSVTDFYADGVGTSSTMVDPTGTVDSTLGIQAALNTIDATNGGAVYFPYGQYKVTATLTVTNCQGFLIYGAGEDASRLVPTTALSGLPVVKFTNCRDYEMCDMGIDGNASGKPEAAVTFHRAASGGYAPTNFKLSRLLLGGISNDLLNGVQTTADSDSNNAEGMFTDIKIRNFTEAGYTFEHSNSLEHRIIGGVIDSSAANTIGVKTAGGSFIMVGTAINVALYDFDVANGTQYHPLTIVGVYSESGSGIIRTTTEASVRASFIGYHKLGGTNSTTVIDFQSVDGRISFSECYLDTGASSQTASFPDDGSIAHFDGCTLGITTYSWAGQLTLTNNKHNPGAVTLTQASTGQFYQAGDIGGGFTPRVRNNIGSSVGSTGVSTLSGVLYSQAPATAPTTTGTSKETMFSYTLPANALDTSVDGTAGGRMLRIMASGYTAGNANSKTIGIDFGGTTVATLTNATNNGPMFVEAIVVNRSTNTQRASGYGVTGTVTASTRSAPAETIAGAITITAFATTPTAAGDVVMDLFTVEAL